VVLNPFATTAILPSDRETAVGSGICVIDCSWERASKVFSRRLRGVNRSLPFVLAGNPTNYSKLGKLSSAEALAASLWIVGFPLEAEKLLSEFGWGETFLTLNLSPLSDYARAKSQHEIGQIEDSYFPWVRGVSHSPGSG
jgi:pre-rRNA-processing protein TSR3